MSKKDKKQAKKVKQPTSSTATAELNDCSSTNCK